MQQKLKINNKRIFLLTVFAVALVGYNILIHVEFSVILENHVRFQLQMKLLSYYRNLLKLIQLL